MTNPNNCVRVRARLSGRASVYEANAWAQIYASGLLAGQGVTENTTPDMNVLVNGSPSAPAIVIAETPSGYKIALDLTTTTQLAITAPLANKKIVSIVAYTDDLALESTDTDTTGSPSSCGLIVVDGSPSAEPVAPDDTEIRSAITADGATGSQAAYGVIAKLTITSTTDTITNTLIADENAEIVKLVPESEDPGEGMPLKKGHFIAVYSED